MSRTDPVADTVDAAQFNAYGAHQTPAIDTVVEANRAELLRRSEIGIVKYGVTLGSLKLPHPALLQHALEESLDLANYLRTLLMLPGAAAMFDVLTERRRQIEQEGYTTAHDDAHLNDDLAAYATYYAMPHACREWPATETGYGNTFAEAIVPEGWPVPVNGDRRAELVKAAAMMLAAIEHIDRADTRPSACTQPPPGWRCTRTPGHDGPCAAIEGEAA
jgi:hypothetical protein